jgi:hypothetical protein
MTNPRSLTFALYTHWDTVENIVLLGRDFPALEPNQILSVISRLVQQAEALDVDAQGAVSQSAHAAHGRKGELLTSLADG